VRILQRFLQKVNYLARKYMTSVLVREIKLKEHYKNCQKVHLSLDKTIYTPEVGQMKFFSSNKHLQTTSYTLPDIYTTTINKVIYCSKLDILLTKSRKIISDSVNTTVEQQDYNSILESIYLKQTEKISGVCTGFRSFAKGYYHQLIENIPRLYLLNQPQYKDIKEIKLICTEQLTNIEAFFLPKILPSNVKITLVSPDKNYFIEDFIFPTFLTRRHAGYLPSDYLKFFTEKVVPQRPRRKINRIFISRKAAKKGRHILNEDELFNTLKKHGFKRYVLEEMTIEDQVNIFYDSEYVVGAHGAGLSNIIFAEEIKVLELFPTEYVWPHFYFLSKSLGHTYQYWYGKGQSKNCNFIVDVLEISKLIEIQEMSEIK